MSAAQILPFLKNLQAQGTPIPALLDNSAPPAPNINAPQQQAQNYDPSADIISQANSQPIQNPNLAPETKGHKLLRILTGAAMGAGAGAGSMTFNQGMQEAQQIPFMRQYQQGQLAEQQADIALKRQQAQNINVPGYGSMPAGLARVLFPALIKGQTAENVQTKKGQTAENVANINKRYMAVPNVGLYDTQSKQVIPGSEQGITLTQEHLNDYGLPQEFLGKQMTLQQLAQLERVQNQQTTTVQGANGPALVNKKTAKVTGLGLGNPGMGRPLEVADPNNPGQTLISTGGAAQGQPGKGSASVKVATKAAEGEVPTKIGDQKLAFNTALAHADLLKQAMAALNNGDQQTLNSLKNKFSNEFGSAGPVSAQAISQAYTREVNKMLSGGHLTDAEIAAVGSTLNPTRQSPQQINAVLDSYKNLASSKLRNLNQQKQSAINSVQPKSKNNSDPLGIR